MASPSRRHDETAGSDFAADRNPSCTPHDRLAEINQKESANTLQHIKHPFAPIYDEHSRILMLGTMASPKSREVGFFYGHPQNRFWKVLSHLLDEEDPMTIEGRTALLLRHHIALWDVLASCDINGASDASIRNAEPNDLEPIFAAAPIKAVFTTGTKAYELFRRYQNAPAGIEVLKLPSTSPANAAMRLDDLVDAYRALLQYLP